jgi:hypothetical protein
VKLVPKIKKEFVSVVINQNKISVAWIKKQKDTYSLEQYDYLENPPLNANLTILNPNCLQKFLCDFLKKNSLSNSFISFALDGQCCKHKIIASDTNIPEKKHISKAIEKWYLVDHYLIAQDSSEHHNIFYVTGIVPAVLFQYLNLSIYLKLNTIALTTKPMALACTIQNLQIQEETPYYETFEQWITIMNNQLEKQKPKISYNNNKTLDNINTHLGLFMLGRNIYEAN